MILKPDLDSEADRRTVVVDRLYAYQKRNGDGIGLIGYVLVDLETGWHVKRSRGPLGLGQRRPDSPVYAEFRCRDF